MILLFIAMQAVGAVAVSVVFEWCWAHKLFGEHPKNVACEAFWMMVCVASFICSAAIAFPTILALMVIGVTHAHLVRQSGDVRITPHALLGHLWAVICDRAKRLTGGHRTP